MFSIRNLLYLEINWSLKEVTMLYGEKSQMLTQIPWGTLRMDNVGKCTIAPGEGWVEWVQLELTDALQYHTLYDNFI